MLTADDLRAEVDVLVADLKQELAHKVFSDLVELDEKGCIRHQYVDLVQEGGGVLGVALMGYCYVLEQMGIRFLSLAGTSAGAINTVLLAAAGQPHEERVARVLKVVAPKSFRDFIDGSRLKRWVLLRFLGRGGFKNNLLRVLLSLPLALFLLLRGLVWTLFKIPNFWFKTPMPAFLLFKGLNSGDNFRRWVRTVLQGFEVRNTAEINQKIQPEWERLHLLGSDGKTYYLHPNRRPKVKLALMSTDITTLTKVEFPDMAPLYFPDADTVSPAEYVRASMSVPVFFNAYVRKTAALQANSQAYTALRQAKRFHYKGPMPKEVYFVDGGVLSNFPLDTLYEPGVVPLRPVFGVKLNYDDRIEKIHNQRLSHLALQTFDTARRLHDAEFLKTRPEYEPAIGYIDTGEVNWLNFDLQDQEKKQHLLAGVMAAREFLRRFDWTDFKARIEDKLIQETQDLLWTAWEKTEVFPDKIAYLAAAANRQRNAAPPADIRALRRQIQRAGTLRVLWVDDNPVNDLLEFYLFRYLEIERLHVRSTLEAMQAIREKGREYFWLVVTDNRRGANNNEGIELIRQLREASYEGHIVLSSKSYNEVARQAGMPPLAKDITVLEHNSPSALVAVLARLLERSNAGAPPEDPALEV